MKTSVPHRVILASSFIGLSLGMGTGASFAQQGAARKACEADYHALCSGVQPGGGRIIACLKGNSAKLSPDCQKAIAEAGKGQP